MLCTIVSRVSAHNTISRGHCSSFYTNVLKLYNIISPDKLPHVGHNHDLLRHYGIFVPDILHVCTMIVCIHCRPTTWQCMLFAGVPSIRMSLPAVVLTGPSKYGTTLESKHSLFTNDSIVLYMCVCPGFFPLPTSLIM